MAGSPAKLFSYRTTANRLTVETLEGRHLMAGLPMTTDVETAPLESDSGPALQSDPAPAVEAGASESETLRLPVSFAGLLHAGATTHDHTFVVETPQIVRFSLTATGADGQHVVATLLDSDGNPFLRLTAAAGEETVPLAAGTYRVTVTLPAALAGEAAYTFRGLGLAQYLGPEVVDPSGSPITPCVDGPGEFCYPEGIYSWDSFVWVDDDLEPSSDESSAGASWHDDWWSWYVDYFSSAPDT